MPHTSILAAAAFVLALWAIKFLFRIKAPVRQVHLRGRFLREAPEAAQILAAGRRRGDPGLLVGRQFFDSQIATRHIAFIGTTGSGKTLLQRLLMQSALAGLGRGHGERAVVYDAKRDILSVLGGMGLSAPIHTFNPLDARALGWDMAADIDSPAAALQVAMTLVPESKGDANPFFTNAARHLLYGAILALVELAPGQWTFRQALLVLRDPERLQKLLAGSESTRHLLHYFAHPATAQNIFSTLLTHTIPFEIIAACWDRAGESLSLASWIRSESVLVLGNDEENRVALDTINKLLFRRLAELVLSGPEVDERAIHPGRTWFFLDECREAGKLELLGRLLTKGRSKGVAVALGFQDISGMREVYGRELADELLGQCNTKVILRLNGPETAGWAAKLFGTREVLESRHGSSHNRQRRLNSESSTGESLSHAIAQQPLVLDSEILGLAETSRENGVHALFINPTTGPFKDHIDGQWLSKRLLKPDPQAANFVARPVAHQYLRPWTIEDDILLGFAPGEGTGGDPAREALGRQVPTQEEAWC